MKPWLAFLTFLLCAPGLTSAGEDIAIQDAWVRAAPPGATVMVAYLRIDNHSTSEQVLSGASSPQFDSVEIHRTDIKDGVASMRAVPRLAIPSHGSVSFEPNGYHLMLIGPRQPLPPGAHVELALQFDGQAARQVHAGVRADAAPADDSMHHHHHD